MDVGGPSVAVAGSVVPDAFAGPVEPAAVALSSSIDPVVFNDQPFEKLHVQADQSGELLWLRASARHDQARCLVNTLSLIYRNDEADGATFNVVSRSRTKHSERIVGVVASTANQLLAQYNN